MSADDQIVNIINTLRSFQRRKGMYIQPVSVETVRSFLTGVRVGMLPSGRHGFHPSDWCDALAGQGWEINAACPADEMRRRGLDDTAIMDELIELEIDLWHRMAARGQ